MPDFTAQPEDLIKKANALAEIMPVNTVASSILDRLHSNYFCGTQASIYIGDEWATEILDIEGVYNLDQVPIYGYASHHFDAVAPGRVIVAGSLTMNYVYSGYLYSLIHQTFKTNKSLSGLMTNIANKSASVSKPSTIGIHGNLPDDANAALRADQTIYEQPFDIKTIRANQALYWDKSQGVDSVSSIISGMDNEQHLRPEFIGPFNIHIKDFRLGSINPNFNPANAKEDDFEHKIIIDVYLTKNSLMRRADASPTVEAYSFIARTMI